MVKLALIYRLNLSIVLFKQRTYLVPSPTNIFEYWSFSNLKNSNGVLIYKTPLQSLYSELMLRSRGRPWLLHWHLKF